MRVPNAVHERRPWAIRDIAHDFELLDVWALPVEGGRDGFAEFLDAMQALDPTASGSAISRVLFWIRLQLGKLLGWDSPHERRIPGSAQTTLTARLPPRLRNTGGPINDVLRGVGGSPLYRTEDEAALEICNETVHGVLHLSWVEVGDERYRAHMAIYVKPRGRLGRCYMKLIEPFRHLVVYPALMRQIRQTWEVRKELRAQ